MGRNERTAALGFEVARLLQSVSRSWPGSWLGGRARAARSAGPARRRVRRVAGRAALGRGRRGAAEWGSCERT
jgi:hypothetical protein